MKKLDTVKPRTKAVAGIIAGLLASGAIIAGTGAAAPKPAVAADNTDSAYGISITPGTAGAWIDGKSGQAVDPAKFAMTPWDSLVKAQPVTIDVTGDNAEATLAGRMPELTSDLAQGGAHFRGTVMLVKGSYDPASKAEVNPDDVVASALMHGGAGGSPDVIAVLPKAAGGRQYTVVTTMRLDSNAEAEPASVTGAVLNQTGFDLTPKEVRPDTTPWDIPDEVLRARIVKEAPDEPLTVGLAKKMHSLSLDLSSVRSLSGMEEMVNLRDLSLTNLGGFVSLNELSLSHLQRLRLNGPIAFSDVFWSFSALPSLSSFTVSGDGASNSPLRDLRFLNGDKAMREIYIENAPNLTTLEGLDGIPHLSTVRLHKVGVSDVSALNRLRGACVSVNSNVPINWETSYELVTHNRVIGDGIPDWLGPQS